MTRPWGAIAPVALALVACGGGGSEQPPMNEDPQALAATGGPSLAQRVQAATATANRSDNACGAIGPFYWEVGGAQARLASGSVTPGSDVPAYTESTVMNIASASKWVYGAYVVQKQPVIGPLAVKHLTFRSGYTNFGICLRHQTVQSCLDTADNGKYSPEHDGKFYYQGGHMQKHAALIGLGGLDNAGLAAEIRSQLGADIEIAFSQPQPAGGVVTTPGDYARMLRKMLSGSLRIGSMLGAHATCTNPSTCPTAVSTPIPEQSWDYSLGHWVESDPVKGDGSFSSAGAFGFYPWIDKSKTWYGIVAREAKADGSGVGTGEQSQRCGQLIRTAWVTGVAR